MLHQPVDCRLNTTIVGPENCFAGSLAGKALQNNFAAFSDIAQGTAESLNLRIY